MSVSGSGQELRRATANMTVNISTTNADGAEITAGEDREILGVSVSTDAETRVVVGYSTAEIEDMLAGPSGSGDVLTDVNSARSSIITAYDDADHIQQTLEEPIDWAAGEGLHVGVQNLSSTDTKLVWVVVYYREV